MPNDSKPFEIRASLLHLAKDIISENAHMVVSVANDKKKSVEWPKYSTEEIISEAEKLYAFVSKKP